MYYFILAGGALAVLALVILSIVKDSYPLRMVTVVVLFVMVAIREETIVGRARSLIWDCSLEGPAKAGFQQGVLSLADYCGESSIFVYLVMLVLFVICVRGFRRKNKK